MSKTANEVYRNFVTDGVVSSGNWDPSKLEIRELLTGYETVITAFTSNGGLIYTSKAQMDADLAHGVKSSAWVIGDPVAANNGVYQKQGGSGAGSWTRVADLPYSFIIASDVGAGTANAIQAITAIPVSSSALVWMNIFEANTATPVTVSFNGGSVLTIKTNTGNNPVVGGLVAGMIVLGIVSGATFRLVSDQTSTAIATAAAASAAAAAASAAAAAASAASLTYATIPEQRAGSAPDRISSPYTVTDSFKYRGFVSPLDFGVPGVGNDITTHFLTACADPDIFGITLPPGAWHISDQGLIQNKPFTIRGFGPEVSQLHQHTVGKNAVRFISTQTFSRYGGLEYRTIGLVISDIGIVSPVNQTAAMVYAEWVDRVDETCFFGARNVKIVPDDFDHYYATGIHLKNANGTVLDNVQMVGDLNKRGLTTAAPYNTGVGVYWECGTLFPKVSHVVRGCRHRDMNTAYKMTGWSEGFYFNNCDPVLVGRCFDWDGYSVAEGGVGNPNLHITQSHLNFREHGIVVKDTFNLFIDDVDFLKDGESGASIAGSCVLLNNAPLASISNSRFGRASKHTGLVRGIEATDNINGYRITGNFFDGMLTESVALAGTGQNPNISNNTLVGAGSPQVGIRTTSAIGGGAIQNNVFQGTWALRVDAQNDTVVVKGNTPEDGITTFAIGDTSPSVGGYNSTVFSLANTSATTITVFDNGAIGQTITVIAQNSNTTFAHSVALILQGAVNWNMPAGAVTEFKFDGAAWRQTARIIV
jgi:hypothetical protein